MKDDNEATPNMLKEALSYLHQGWPVIPIELKQRGGKCEKKPLVHWEKYKNHLPTEYEVNVWWGNKYPNAGIALVTGTLSGIVVVDVEKDGPTAGLTPTVISKTGGGGFHYFYKHPGVTVKNSVKNIAPLTDVRGDGGLLVLAPSLHGSGKRYEWVVPPGMTDYADLPQWILEKSKSTTGETRQVDWKVFTASEIPAGERNATAAQYIGKILHDLSSELWQTAGWVSAKAWNTQFCKPPLDDKELRSVFDSIAGREEASRAKKATPDGEIETI